MSKAKVFEEFVREVGGAHGCPICGTTRPHTHNAIEVADYRERQVAASRVSQAKRIDLQPNRLLRWLVKTFGPDGPDIEERVLRLTEETLELGQAEGMTREQAHALVDQVFDKPVGDPHQELGGLAVCAAAYCAAKPADFGRAFIDELERIERPEVVDKIRTKHATKTVVSSKLRP